MGLGRRCGEMQGGSKEEACMRTCCSQMMSKLLAIIAMSMFISRMSTMTRKVIITNGAVNQ
jgi:hypothetical protein